MIFLVYFSFIFSIKYNFFNFELYGIEEIKDNDDKKLTKNIELGNQNTNLSVSVKICNNLSIAIETAIFIQNGESIKV